ncbi:MAG: hypothetical protein KGP35_09520 [Bacteroidetes bacterium]|nr:hypothetical protein [Bacteroidota bacterium]
MSDGRIYSIPSRFRRIENLHILFWLVKDLCWAMNFRYIGLLMIIPTLVAALMITWQTRKIFSERMHNLAVVFWIIANCTWMVGEFFGIDEGSYGLRTMAIIPFSIGLVILASFYIRFYTQQKTRQKVMEQTYQTIEKELSK